MIYWHSFSLSHTHTHSFFSRPIWFSLLKSWYECVCEWALFFSIAWTVVDVSMRCFTSVRASYNLWMCVYVCEWCFLKVLTILSIRAFLLLRFISNPMKMLLLNLASLSKFVCVFFFSFYIRTQTFNLKTVSAQQHSFRKWFQRIVSHILKSRMFAMFIDQWLSYETSTMLMNWMCITKLTLRIVALKWTMAINQCIVLIVFTLSTWQSFAKKRKIRRKTLHR